MVEFDTVDQTGSEHDAEHELLLNHVVQDDHELLYLDTYLSEFLR